MIAGNDVIMVTNLEGILRQVQIFAGIISFVCISFGLYKTQ